MDGVNVDISIRDNTTGKYYRVPVLPETPEYIYGEALKDTVKVIGLGNVDFPNGTDLEACGWSSFFPKRYDPSYCTTSDLLEPLAYVELFNGWKNASTSLQLICPALGINQSMTLNSFKASLGSFEGDIDYTADFKQDRDIKPVMVPKGGTVSKAKKATTASRKAVAKKAKPATHKVKAGECITGIAKRYGINPWRELYAKNKAAIGTDPSKLKAGTVLKIC